MQFVWWGVGSLMGLLVLSVAALYVKSWFYDRNDERNRPHSYYSRTSVELPVAVKDVYRFMIEEHHKKYSRYQKGHQTFSLRNSASLAPGVIIDCTEQAGSELVTHEYHVTATEANRLIQYDSRPTTVYELTNGQRKQIATCRTFVYYDFTSLGPNRSSLTQTIILDMGNPLMKLITDLIAHSQEGNLWGAHFQEELQGLRDLIVESSREG